MRLTLMIRTVLVVSLIVAASTAFADMYNGTVVISCVNADAAGTGSHVLNRDNTGMGQERIRVDAVDGVGTLLYTLTFQNVLGAFAGGMGDFFYTTAPQFNPIAFKTTSLAGNGFPELARIIGKGSCAGLSTRLTTGAGPGGGPHVQLVRVTAPAVSLPPGSGLFPFALGFAGGVRVASGDVNGDGVADIIVGAGPGGGPQVRVFSGANPAVQLANFFAFDPAFTGGVYVAAGDVNGDGRADIIVGAGAGGGPHVRVFSGANPAVQLANFFPFALGFTGGVRVAAGDVNGDGRADIIVGAGAGGGPHVRVFSGANPAVQLANFFAFAPAFAGGVEVAAGNVNSDALADIIVGAGPGGGPHVRVFSGANPAVQLANFFAFSAGFTGGVHVAAADINSDARADIIVGAGPGAAPHVRVFSGANPAVELASFFAYSLGFTGGAHVAGPP